MLKCVFYVLLLVVMSIVAKPLERLGEPLVADDPVVVDKDVSQNHQVAVNPKAKVNGEIGDVINRLLRKLHIAETRTIYGQEKSIDELMAHVGYLSKADVHKLMSLMINSGRISPTTPTVKQIVNGAWIKLDNMCCPI